MENNVSFAIIAFFLLLFFMSFWGALSHLFS